jgi:hypothetical protein
MKRPTTQILLALASTALFSTAAQATSTWSFACGGSGKPACDSTVSSSLQFAGTGTTNTAKVSGWANTGATGDVSEKKLASGTVRAFSGGLGITSAGESTSSPNHAVDSAGADEFVLVSFAQAVKLSAVSIGWFSGDADISVLAYTGAGVPTLTGNTLAATDTVGGSSVGLINAGWSLVGHYAKGATNNYAINPTNIQSSYWLVGAYNARVGTPNSALTKDDDYFKLLTVAGTTGGTPNTVPGPSTLALMAIGLPLLRRRFARV